MFVIWKVQNLLLTHLGGKLWAVKQQTGLICVILFYYLGHKFHQHLKAKFRHDVWSNVKIFHLAGESWLTAACGKTWLSAVVWTERHSSHTCWLWAALCVHTITLPSTCAQLVKVPHQLRVKICRGPSANRAGFWLEEGDSDWEDGETKVLVIESCCGELHTHPQTTATSRPGLRAWQGLVVGKAQPGPAVSFSLLWTLLFSTEILGANLEGEILPFPKNLLKSMQSSALAVNFFLLFFSILCQILDKRKWLDPFKRLWHVDDATTVLPVDGWVL